MCHANVVNFFKTRHAHYGRPGGEPAGRGAEGAAPGARSACELQGPFRPLESGRAGGAVARPPNPSPTRQRVSDLEPPPSQAAAVPRGRRGEGPGSPNGAAAAGAAPGGLSRGAPAPPRLSGSHASSSAPCSAEPGRAAMRTAGHRDHSPAAFAAAPRPLRPGFPAAPGHAAPRAGAGS